MNTLQLNQQLVGLLGRTPRPHAGYFAFLSDLHIHHAGEYTSRKPGYPSQTLTRSQLRKIVDELNALDPGPEFVVFGGDLTDYGIDREWDAFFEEATRLRMPYHLALGNHDHNSYMPDYSTLFRLFNEKREEHLGSISRSTLPADQAYAFEQAGYRIVILDARDTGELSEDQHEMLDQYESRPSMPTIFVVHRPVLPVGNWVDHHMLIDKKFLERLTADKGAIAVLSGHVHKSRAWLYKGVRHLINPAVAYGIGDRVGYRLIGLSQGKIAWSAVRYLHGRSMDQYERWDKSNSDYQHQQVGALVIDVPEVFESHELCHPYRWPQEVDPSERHVTEGALEQLEAVH